MAGEKHTRRFVKFWRVLALMSGAVTGAFSVHFFGLAQTLWWIIGGGIAIAAAAGIFEWFDDRRWPGPRLVRNGWGKAGWSNRAGEPRKPPVGKPRRRAQLHAIAGRKSGEPPSSGAS
jgi:hypothetical protein